MKFFPAAEANRQFSKILREVRGGETVVITVRGKPVAMIQPTDRSTVEREVARAAMLKRLDSQPAQHIPITWTRGDLYDD
jgi:prevent-host-death family protein